MTRGIRSKILLSFGILVVVLGCSSTAFSQTKCTTVTIAPGTKIGGSGQTVEYLGDTDTGDSVFRICRDAANSSSPAQPTNTPACPNPPAQQPTMTPAQAAEEARREEAEKKEERKRAEEERRRSINEWKYYSGMGSRDRW